MLVISLNKRLEAYPLYVTISWLRTFILGKTIIKVIVIIFFCITYQPLFIDNYDKTKGVNIAISILTMVDSTTLLISTISVFYN